MIIYKLSHLFLDIWEMLWIFVALSMADRYEFTSCGRVLVALLRNFLEHLFYLVLDLIHLAGIFLGPALKAR